MREFRTTKCRTYGKPEIVILLDEDSNLSPDWLISFFEKNVEDGHQFEAEQTVQIGWMITMLRASEDAQCLEVWEPRFDSMPIQWSRGVTNTLHHLILQQSVCQELGVQPTYPSLRDAGVVAPSFGDSEEGFTMSRDEGDGNDSGWVFAPIGYSGSEGQFQSLFELSQRQPKVIPFLALPSGASVVIKQGQVDVEYGESHLSSAINPLLSGIV